MQRTPIILAIAFICTLLSCNNEIKYPDGGYAYPEHADDKDIYDNSRYSIARNN